MNTAPHRILHRLRRLLVTVGGSFMLALLGMSLAYLHATLFDHRFAFAVAGVCVMGLAAGTAIHQWLEKNMESRMSRIPWFALMGLFAAITTSIFFVFSVASIGSTGAFLLAALLAAFPYAFWSIGLADWLRNQEISWPQLILATMLGAIAGVFASFPLAEHFHGPLFTVWLATAGLVFLALVSCRHVVMLALAGLSAFLLVLAGMLGAWDFTVPPRWSDDGAPLGKLLYTNDNIGNSMVRAATRWDDLARTDIIFDKKIPDLTLVFKNGALSGILPAGYSGKTNPEQLRNYFPLFALPQMAGRARDILVIDSGGGMEIKMAADSGIPHINGKESNRALKPIVEQHRELYEHLLNNPGARLDYGDIRHALRKDTIKYDQIYLTIPPMKIPGGTEPGILENYLYTREAFRDYWAHLKPGGMLVVLAGEEMLYMRALLVAWEVLDEDRAGGNVLLGKQAWGYRMLTLTPPVKPYQYLLMLVKGPIGDETANRVEQQAQNMVVEKLFGPGMLPPAAAFSIYNNPYYILYHPKGPVVAREAWSEYISWHLKARASLNTPTDQHPNFFQITDDMHPALKWLVAICSVLLIYVCLFPLGAERRLDNPVNNARPPLPMHLSYCLALSAGAMMALVALASQAVLLTERAGDTLTTVMATAVLGAGTAVFFRRRGVGAPIPWHAAALTAAALSGLFCWILTGVWELAAEWPFFARLVVVAVMTFPLGLFTTQLLLHGLDHLRQNLPALVPWAIVMHAAAAPVGAVAAFWFCQYWGWGVVWASVAGCYLVVLGIGAYFGSAVHGGMKQAPAQP